MIRLKTRTPPQQQTTDSSEPLHIKYRPRTLEKVIGQRAVCESLNRALSAPNKAHAYLLTGPSGAGKTTLARIIAGLVGVPTRGVLEIDAATNSGVENMRAVTDMVRYKSLHNENGLRFIIVDECHSLGRQTWQSLLKSIEEPPSHVFWAFCTTEADKVPETIRTRCLTYNLSPVPEDDIAELLAEVNAEEGLGVSDDILGAISRQCRGSVRQALVSLAQVRGVSDRKEALRLLETGVGDEGQAVALARMLCSGKGGCSWANAMKICEGLQQESPEGVRLVIVRYASAALKSGKNPEQLLAVLDAFRGPYMSSELWAPLYLSLGQLLL